MIYVVKAWDHFGRFHDRTFMVEIHALLYMKRMKRATLHHVKVA